MPEIVKLEQPGLFDDFWLPYFSRRESRAILRAAKEAAKHLDYQPNIAVVVRTRNDRAGLEAWVKHIEAERRSYKSRIDLIVVDTESTDGTLQVAKKAGAAIVPIRQKDFNYPKGINMGFEKVKPDVEAAYLSVGHARPAVNICLQALARHFENPKVVAAYADTVPNANATTSEKNLLYFAWGIQHRFNKGVYSVPRLHGGMTQGTGCMVRMSAWREHKYDEAYGHGGEDLAWGRWALGAGYSLIFEPAAAMHHTHGLKFVNFMRQLRYWFRAATRRGEFDEQRLHKYRPDLHGSAKK